MFLKFLNGLRFKLPLRIGKMNSYTFVQNLNPLNNKMEWKVVHDDYGFNQEIATSCYGDMLHDDERNKKFGEALKVAIEKIHSAGKEAHVLDIGTGTGLLSMLAVRYGADSVTACEAFLPMANCAIEVINENDCFDKIKVVKSHSTSLTVGQNGDLKQRANILVSEVFDTELIGEGAIKTFNHAFEHLVTEDCIVIPSSGTVYAQVVESELAAKWNKLQDWKLNDGVLLKIPNEISSCCGTAAVHDIQLSEFSQEHFKALSKPIPIFKFSWAKNEKIPTSNRAESVVKAISSGKAQVLFVWWELNMVEEGQIIISCSPVWEHPDAKGRNVDLKTLTKTLPWRDHWMQAVYFITNEITVCENDSFVLESNHDEFSFWFQVRSIDSQRLKTPQPVCNCMFHFLLSRARIGAINDSRRQNVYFNALKSVVTKNTVCIVLGDTSLLGFVLAKLGTKKVYILSENSSFEKVCEMFCVKNELTDVVSKETDISQIVQNLDGDMELESSDIMIVSEPYFHNSILPWDNMVFWYIKEEICNKIKKLNRSVKSITTFPVKCKLRGCVVQFDNLWRIATPLNTCEGFSMKIFDNLMEVAKAKAENYTEAQPLWEYPSIALSLPLTFFEFSFDSNIVKEKKKKNGIMKIEHSGRCDGVALWMEYDFTKDHSLSFGPLKEIVTGQYIAWDMYEKQGVHLFRKNANVNIGDSMHYDVEFNPLEGEINFFFQF